MKRNYEPSETMKAGYAFAQALRIAADHACEDKDTWSVFYYMKRAQELEGTLRTIERMEQR